MHKYIFQLPIIDRSKRKVALLELRPSTTDLLDGVSMIDKPMDLACLELWLLAYLPRISSRDLPENISALIEVSAETLGDNQRFKIWSASAMVAATNLRSPLYIQLNASEAIDLIAKRARKFKEMESCRIVLVVSGINSTELLQKALQVYPWKCIRINAKFAYEHPGETVAAFETVKSRQGITIMDEIQSRTGLIIASQLQVDGVQGPVFGKTMFLLEQQSSTRGLH